MKPSRKHLLFAALFSLTAFVSPVSLFAASGQKVMVATADSRATQAALDVLRAGGNAVDAAVAAQWILNVVEPHSSGIGGGGFFLYYEAKTGKVYAFDGRETAPAQVFPEMFLDENKKPYRFWPERITGGLPAGVPGVLKLLHVVHSRFGSGKVTFGELFRPAIEIARKGFEISPRLARFIEGEKERLVLFPDSRKIFLDAEGNGLKPGDMLVQEDLARTFELVADEGPGLFYEGEIARDIVKAVRTAPFHPGLMVFDDLRHYKVVERTPVHGAFRTYEIYGMPPPSSGGPAVQETLNILEHFPLTEIDQTGRISVFAQAQRLAFIDRNRYLADPDQVAMPMERILSLQHAARLAAMIDPASAKAIQPKTARPGEGAHTSHISIADADGNLVSFTTTIEHMFGSAMIVPGRGFFLNNELTDFDAEPLNEDGVPAANAPGPGKRPRSSMSPTLVFQDGRPVLIVGSPGGSRIIGAVLNVLVNVLEYGMPLQEALAAPRILNRSGPVELEEPLFENKALAAGLQARGFEIEEASPAGNVQAVLFHEGTLTGGSDPRGDGLAAGY